LAVDYKRKSGIRSSFMGLIIIRICICISKENRGFGNASEPIKNVVPSPQIYKLRRLRRGLGSAWNPRQAQTGWVLRRDFEGKGGWGWDWGMFNISSDCG